MYNIDTCTYGTGNVLHGYKGKTIYMHRHLYTIHIFAQETSVGNQNEYLTWFLYIPFCTLVYVTLGIMQGSCVL